MRHRVVIVPKDKAAEKALEFDKATKEELIELKIEEDEFLFMYQNGIIELINTEGNVNIDDFEDDYVKGKENIGKVIKALSLKVDLKVEPYSRLNQSLLSQFKEALERETGVYFYF